MSVVEGIEVGRYLEDLMLAVARATPGLLSVDRATDGKYTLTSTTGGLVAVVNRKVDADLFARDRLDLRALVTGIAEVIGHHEDDGTGHCVQDGQPVPCITRQDLESHLAQRVGSA